MKINPRIIELCNRLTSPGSVHGKLSASEFHELVDFIWALEELFSMEDYIERQSAWSSKTFGPTPRTKGITAHIRKELLEIENAPLDLEEWVDVMILAMDGAWRSGHSSEEIVAALIAKQEKNFKRTYPKPLSDDLPSEHDRTGEVAK